MKRYLALILSMCLLFAGVSFLLGTNIEGSDPDPFWGPTDVNTKVCDANGVQDAPVVVQSDDGGAFISWVDRRDPDDWDIYIQKMDRFGNPVFQKNGMPVCTAPGNQSEVHMIPDDIGGVFLTWVDRRNAPFSQNIYGQRIEWDGTVAWEENGITVTSAPYPSTQKGPRIIPDGNGGALISWVNDTYVDDIVPYYIREILVQRFLPSGDSYWLNDVKVVEKQDYTIRPELVSDGDGGAIILWEENLGPATTDIYAQRVNSDGMISWESNIPVCTASFDQNGLYSIPDGQGGVISAWSDNRAGTTFDVYASRLNSTGDEQWKSGGNPICTETGAQNFPAIIMGIDGGAFITWMDYRDDTSIFMQKVDADGKSLLEENGTEVGDPFMDKWSPKPIPANDGFFYLFWYQGTIGSFDIHGQLFHPNGSKVWNGYSEVISDAPRNQILMDAFQGALGSAFLVWVDDRDFDFEYDIYMTRVGSTIITRSPIMEISEDDAYYFDLGSSNGNVTWSLSFSPDWLSIDPITGELSGTPLNGDVGKSNVWVTITDGTGSTDNLVYQLTVKNRIPTVISGVPPSVAQEESEYQFTFESDDDGQGTITWALLEGPDWLSMNSTTGLISGVPQNDDVGKYFITVSVDDGNEGVAELSYMLEVEDDNDAPYLLTEYLPSGIEGEFYFSILSASDPDLKEEILMFSMETDAAWLNINETRGIISGTPDEDGNFWVNISVSDIDGYAGWKNFSIFVLLGEGPPLPFDEETDSDGDGMPDAWEIYYGLNMGNATDASLDDDGDGISNLDEFKNGTSPSKFDPDPNVADSDGDGMPDWWEIENLLTPTFDDSDEDADGDAFTNIQEFEHDTDPWDKDNHPPFPDDDDDDDDEVPTEKDLELTYIIVACVIFLGLVIFGIFFLAGSSRKKRMDDHGWEE